MASKLEKDYKCIFEHEYFFHGVHAERLIMLTNQIGDNSSSKLFQHNIDVFMVAPIIGFIYNRRSELDKNTTDRTINYYQMNSRKDDIIFNYRLIMLLDKDYEPNSSKRIDKAFRHFGTPKAEADEKRFEEYMRGGIDVLYEKLIQPGHNYQNNLIDFLEEFNDRYVAATDDINLVDVAHSI